MATCAFLYSVCDTIMHGSHVWFTKMLILAVELLCRIAAGTRRQPSIHKCLAIVFTVFVKVLIIFELTKTDMFQYDCQLFQSFTCSGSFVKSVTLSLLLMSSVHNLATQFFRISLLLNSFKSILFKDVHVLQQQPIPKSPERKKERKVPLDLNSLLCLRHELTCFTLALVQRRHQAEHGLADITHCLEGIFHFTISHKPSCVWTCTMRQGHSICRVCIPFSKLS